MVGLDAEVSLFPCPRSRRHLAPKHIQTVEIPLNTGSGMKRPGLWLGLALILVTNAFVLTGVAYNRSTEPEAVIQLTERESNLSYSVEENTGIALQLAWHQQREYRSYTRIHEPGWFDQAKLESLGFDCSTPLTDPEADWRYRKALPRQAYVVLEYEGKGWQDLLSAKEQEVQQTAVEVERQERSPKVLENAREELERFRMTGSRLVAVDTGLDPSRLRQLYPDRHRFIVLPAEVSLQYVPQTSDKTGIHPAYLYGRISGLRRDEIHVPLEHRSLLERIRMEDQRAGHSNRYDRTNQEPRYSVVINYGKKREPWIVDVQPLPAPTRERTQNKS